MPSKPSSLTFGEMSRAVFRGQDRGEVPWKPRLEHWHQVNRRRAALPAARWQASLLDDYGYRLTVFPDLGHDCWTRVCEDAQFYG